jgi:2-keto-3-deoxy-L-rhamnonate aldolase RhmA
MNQTFKQALKDGELLVGTFVKTPSSMVCEVLANTQLDVLCLDAEHSPFDRGSLDSCLLACRAGQMPALVRVPSSAPEHILNALDCGATGILAPHIDSVEAAKTLAKKSQFGAGGRGYAGSTRAANYTGKKIAEHLQDSADNTAVIAQIEDIEALDCIDEIVAVEGIDCFFIGMIDLTVALGASSPKDPKVIAAAERICKAAQAKGRRLGIFVAHQEDVGFWRERGVTLFLLGSDHGFMLQGAKHLADTVKNL